MISLPDQPLAERILRARLSRDDPPQQMLLHGPPGTGKTRAAIEIAWNLMDPDEDHRRTADALDLTVLRALGTQILMADLDAGLSQIASRPSVMRRRILVVEGAERLRGDSAARVLKTLEEPPPQSHIILVTDNPQDVLPTIRSRCLPVPFRRTGWRAVASHLEQQGADPDLAAARARAEGPRAITATPLESEMRRLGVELGIAALLGRGSPSERVATVSAQMETAAGANPSDELLRLRAEADELEGKRGGRTAAKRAEDQEKRERRRLVSDGWGAVLDAAASIASDALALALGAGEAMRHRHRADELESIATPDRVTFLMRAIEELQISRAALQLNPTVDLAAEAVMTRIDAARAGSTEPLVPPGRLPG